MSPSSFRNSCFPWWALPDRERSESCPVKLDVDACPPVLEYTPLLSTMTLMGVLLVRMRDSAPKPMS